MRTIEYKDLERLGTEKIIEMIKEDELEIIFEKGSKERGLGIGKGGEYFESFGRPTKRYKRYQEWEQFIDESYKIWLQVKGY